MADKRFSVLVDSLEYCIICGKPYPHKHEIFFGTKCRNQSIEHGDVIPLCFEHHKGSMGIHNNRQFDLAMKKRAQMHFEENKGTREDFRRIFGMSYL